MNERLRRTLTLGAATIVLLAIITAGAPSTRSDTLIEEATLTQNLALYPDTSLITNAVPDGFYQDGLLDIPYVRYSLVGGQQGPGFIIDTTTLQSVTIQAGNTLPPDGPLESLGGFDFYATVYEGDIFSGPASEVGTTLYSNIPPPPPLPSSLYLTVTTGGNSLSGQPTEINAAVTVATTPPPNSELLMTLPSGVTTLQQAASTLHVDGFNWQQSVIYLPSPSPFWAASDSCVQSNPLTYFLPGVGCPSLSAPPALNDPPLGGYKSLFGETPSVEDSYPFYYKTSIPLITPDLLEFSDNPDDACLPGGILIVNPACPDPSGSYVGFTTTLVGENFDQNGDGTLVPLPFNPGIGSFTWTDTFNGTSGGICCFLSNPNPVDPESGTGGITLVAVDGVPVGVPEPSTLTVLSTAVATFGLVRRRKQSLRLFGRRT